jgi:hypothetical protein
MFASLRTAFAALASLTSLFGTATAATPVQSTLTQDAAERAMPDVTALLEPVSAGVPVVSGDAIPQEELDDEAPTVIDQKTAVFVRPTLNLRDLALV